MADSSGSKFPAHLLVKAIQASLRLANESVDSLNISQLLAMQIKLYKTLGIVDQKIRDNEKTISGELF
jgi:hypothetical protein